MSAHRPSRTGFRQRHAHRGAKENEFEQRAAIAWIRAADAGVIDAGELDWLLGKLGELQSHAEGRPATDEIP